MKIENRNIDELENRIRQAGNGDMEAQYQLGMLYRTKEHLHYKEAFRWLLKAAEHGIDSAQYELGEAYERGISFRRNISKALDWYQKAAAAGNKEAQEALERLNNQRQALKEQEAYFLQLVEEKQFELIWHPERREECSIFFSYGDSAQIVYVYREDCPMSAFREYAMSLLLIFYAEKLAEVGKSWLPYAALAVNYLRKLPPETRENHLGLFYARIAALYEKSGDIRRATWYQKQAVGHQFANEFNLENVEEMLDKMSEQEIPDFCLYVLYHIAEQGCFGEDEFYPDWQREQYELQEYVLDMTVKRFADNGNNTTLTRSFIYFLKGIYLKRTCRFKLAESIWKAYLELPNVKEEASFTPSLIHALWGECCLHRTDEAHAKEHFLMVREEEEPFVWKYVQDLLDKKEVSAENLNQACYEAVTNACCQNNGTPRSLKESIDAFFAPPEIYEEEEDEEEDNEEEECAYTFDTWYNWAEDGNRFAQLMVGFFYYQGEVVTRNYRLTREWFYLSALQGNAAAQMNLAYMYAHGYGVEADAQQAAQWRKKAEANPSLSLKSYRDLLLI